ncbi:MAG: hypothetical protein HOP12_12755 [Candidatus Eisenbacteria bacterium]|uniref:Two pore domain potassium channel family protein n=1 Tax=Eiseniibacteriota bacterium TaxID=2212470 RepID=A0A849SQ28_UNCEI|nr:hypothetical protein [Candidatus Eisenbacteria bacterium]
MKRALALEPRHKPLAPARKFRSRLLRFSLLAVSVIGVSLLIGVAGYHWLAHFSWLDALVNASMILGGMGPVDPVHTTGGKWFASIYALYSGVTLLTSVGLLFAPIVHRFLHRFHLEDRAGGNE